MLFGFGFSLVCLVEHYTICSLVEVFWFGGLLLVRKFVYLLLEVRWVVDFAVVLVCAGVSILRVCVRLCVVNIQCCLGLWFVALGFTF